MKDAVVGLALGFVFGFWFGGRAAFWIIRSSLRDESWCDAGSDKRIVGYVEVRDKNAWIRETETK